MAIRARTVTEDQSENKLHIAARDIPIPGYLSDIARNYLKSAAQIFALPSN